MSSKSPNNTKGDNPFEAPEERSYAPPPGSPPTNQYAPPPGPPPSTQYAPPPGAPPNIQYAPPPGSPPSKPTADDLDVPPAEELPPYTKNAPPGGAVTFQGDVRIVTLAAPPADPTDDYHRPLDPPPECFSKPTPPRIRSHSFTPFRIPSIDARLAAGFQPLYAPDALGPHGISPDDWLRFLRDLRVAARLAHQGISAVAPDRTTRAPMTLRRGLGVLSGPRSVGGGPYDAAFVKTPVEEVNALIDVWQGSAFERRKLKVTLHTRADSGRSQREGYDLYVEAL
jgi:hypothetical protein